MSSFVEERFPDDITYNYTGGPVFRTEIAVSNNGQEQRNIGWQNARSEYYVQYDFKDQQQIDKLLAFFYARKGQAVGFRLKDWTDYTASAQHIGTGNGINTEFKLVKQYISGAVTVVRNIIKPVAGTVKIYLDSVFQNGGYSINHSTGLVNLYVAPADGVSITADFEFNVAVRFASDEMKIEAKNNGTYSWNKIKLVEVRS